ncbi:hypothetical protein E2986_03717 [Frieseomelitta varia]|uniref:Uncharacterized protein n=1 Tax=Frieseomelitta varia TaxID=561572 RepID=A0A833SCH6_9HYME|nr:uncharacterized protein LOC122533480 [Frieseomelitta varia]KAF3429725.1 hypothetical protein E2986_03717 [Frieseomelitta varia]
MLGLIVRGVFLVGILTWYSTSVWKIIDGYFRDQFRSYLEEEYRKNPRMRTDVQSGSADNSEPSLTDSTTAPPREILEAAETAARAVEAAENDSTSGTSDEERMTGGTSENEANAGGSADKNAFLGTVAESRPAERRKLLPESGQKDSRQLINDDDRDLEEKERGRRSVSQASKGTARKTKRGRRLPVPRDISRERPELPKRRNVRTVTFTERDFKSVIRDYVSNDDFWEFEEDADEKEPLEGILVSELPFKPRADIGDLDRVTEDEYCPLSLEDEASCGETFKWP